MKPYWFIPTHGDSRHLGTTHGARAATPGALSPGRSRPQACSTDFRSRRVACSSGASYE